MNTTASLTQTLDVSSWPRAVLAGIVATAVETLMMYKGATMMIGQPMDIALELGQMMNVSWTIGMILHVLLGIVIFPLAYASVARQLLPGPNVLRGIIWGLILWAVAMFAMSPMMGKGFFMGGMPQGVAALLAHIVYGGLLGVVAGNGATRA